MGWFDGSRKEARRDARLERIQARQRGRTERVQTRSAGRSEVAALTGEAPGAQWADLGADALQLGAGFASDFLGGGLPAERDDLAPIADAPDAPQLPAPVDDGPALTEDPIGWAKANPGKAAGAVAVVLGGLKLAKVW